MAAPKNPVSGRTVKKTTYNILNPLAKPKVTTTTERTTRKPTAKPKVPASRPLKKPVPKASKELMPKRMTGEEAAKRYQREISPKGMARTKAKQSKAIDKKYPGLYKSATPKPKRK